MGWVLSKMLAKDREERYQSAKEVLVDLRKLRHSTLGASTTAAVPAAARAAPGPGRLALIAGALVAVAAVVALAVWKGRAPSIEKPPSPPATPVPATGAIPAASAAPMKIAVLPLQNVRKDPRIDFLGFALADALISKLSYLNSVAVRPSSYVQKYRDAAPEPKQVGAELGVDHLLLGTLLAEGDTLRISVQLVDLGSDSVRWQDMFDARLDNLLGVQDTIVNRLVAGMKVTLTPAESTLLKRDESRDPEAFDLLLRATALPVTEEGTRKAIELLQASLKKDPSFAPTWEALAERQYGSAEYLSGGPGDYEAAAQSRRRALDINPDLPEALFSFGTNLVETGDHEQAYRWFHGRLSTNPSDARAHFLLSYLYRYTGMLRESAEEAERALALDSRNRLFRSGARTFFYLGEIDRAAPFLALDPDTTWTFANRIEGEVIRGDLAKARSWGEKCIAADPNSILADRCRAFLLIIEGDTAAAVRLTRPQFDRVVPDVELLYNAAALRSWMGEVEPALDLLDRAVKGGFFPYTYFEIDPRLKALRSQPRYASIRDEAHRRSDAFRSFVAANP
jgi:TolB-like protein/Tfp pilus assembly protein PilF